MNKSIRNALVASAVVIGALGVAGAATQAPKPAGRPVGGGPARSHSHTGGRIFAEYDLNKDGKITRDEFNKATAEQFAQATHGGKTMSEQQFAAFRTRSLQQRSDQMFRRADWSGDGKLSFDEYANPIRASFARADRQSAGFITCRSRQEDGAEPVRASGSQGRRNGRRNGGSRGAGSFCVRDDLNHDGKVTRAELDQALQQQFAGAAKGSKALTRDQFLAMQDTRARDTSSRGFGRLDRDHSGTLTLAEFSEPQNRLFARLDKNGDGVITRDELSSSRRSRGTGRASVHG